MKNMHCRLNSTSGLTCLALATLVLAAAGCAGNRYSRSTGEYIDDHSLQLRVDHALGENADYKFKEVGTATFKGTVELNGFVDTADQKNEAGNIVKQVAGVRQVDNNIFVEQNNPRTAGEITDDKALAARVRDTLHGDPYKFDGVAVTAYKGTVQLSGFVDTADQKNKAAEVAKTIQGVRDAQNDIIAKDQMAMQ
jgi:hyperosmotically inducible protein